MDGSGLTQMIVQDQFSEIKMMFGLFKKCPASLTQFKAHLKQYIIQEGYKLVRNDSIANDDLVRKIIHFRERMISLLNKSLDKDMTVDLTIKNAFEAFINENEKTAQSLVAYLDEQYKKDFKLDSQSEVAEKIDRVIQIFRYL